MNNLNILDISFYYNIARNKKMRNGYRLTRTVGDYPEASATPQRR